MSKTRRPADRPGYALQRATIRQLHEKGVTREPSEKALRERAVEGILVFLESAGNAHYYDLILSAIRCNAARACKRPGVQWADIGEALRILPRANDRIKALLDEGLSHEQVEAQVADEISTILNSRSKRG